MVNVSREMKRSDFTGILDKNTITELKNDFDGFVKRLNIPEERIIAPKE